MIVRCVLSRRFRGGASGRSGVAGRRGNRYAARGGCRRTLAFGRCLNGVTAGGQAKGCGEAQGQDSDSFFTAFSLFWYYPKVCRGAPWCGCLVRGPGRLDLMVTPYPATTTTVLSRAILKRIKAPRTYPLGVDKHEALLSVSAESEKPEEMTYRS